MPRTESRFASERRRQRAEIIRLLRVGVNQQPDLVAHTGLSASSIHRLVKSLVKTGHVVESGTAGGSLGRPATVLELEPRSAVLAVGRLGAATLEVRLYGLDGQTLLSEHVPWRGTRLEPGAIADAVREAADRVGCLPELSALVLAVPGVVHPDSGAVSEAPDLGWTGSVPLADLLGDFLGLPVKVENDINLMALGEHVRGRERERSIAVFYVGSGIGSALLLDGEPAGGAHGGAGEIGLLPVQIPAGDAVRLEDRYGIPALRTSLGMAGDRSSNGVVAEMVKRAHAEPGAAELLEETLSAWAFGMAALVLVSDPDSLLIAGAAAELDADTMERLRERLARIVPAVPRLSVAVDGDESMFIGAERAASILALEQGIEFEDAPHAGARSQRTGATDS